MWSHDDLLYRLLADSRPAALPRALAEQLLAFRWLVVAANRIASPSSQEVTSSRGSRVGVSLRRRRPDCRSSVIRAKYSRIRATAEQITPRTPIDTSASSNGILGPEPHARRHEHERTERAAAATGPMRLARSCAYDRLPSRSNTSQSGWRARPPAQAPLLRGRCRPGARRRRSPRRARTAGARSVVRPDPSSATAPTLRIGDP